MSAPASQITPDPDQAALSQVPASEVDASCRVPLLGLFSGAAIWLVVSGVAALLASMSFHAPGMFADCEWLSYGRIAPVAKNALLYGFAIQAGWAVALWLLARLGRAPIRSAWGVVIGAKLWNIGVLVGLLGILAGSGTGFELFEMPSFAGWFLLLASLFVGIAGFQLLQRRAEAAMYPSQWFAGLALLWFPWIFVTATLLLLVQPVRGIAQASIHWWYVNQLTVVFFGLMGIGALLYFLPKLRQATLHSEYQALFLLITLVFCGGFMGIPQGAPLPSWMGTLSGGASVLILLPALALAVNLRNTRGRVSGAELPVEARFFHFSLWAFLIWAVATAILAGTGLHNLAAFTLLQPGLLHLLVLGFLGMSLLGAAYHILPRVAGVDVIPAGLVRLHFWLAQAGIALIVLPYVVGGLRQGAALAAPETAFVDVAKGTLMSIRVATMGELLILLGHLVFAVNLALVLKRLAGECQRQLREVAVAPIETVEVGG